jgi:outer membrane receptor protein involved in Fe transport
VDRERRDHLRQRDWLVRCTEGALFGPRPLIEDDSVHSLASLIFNARAGYRFDNGLKLQLDVLNLFDAQTNQIEYYYLSRLPGEPIGGIADRHIHPAEPRAIRLTLAGKF